MTEIVQQKKSLVRDLEESYLAGIDWERNENANHNVSYSNFRNYLFEKLVKSKEVLSEYLPPLAIEQHYRGDIHIHKLPDSLWIPYCAGWSYKKILQLGLKTPTIISAPARHFDTAVAHLVNFFFMGAQEWTGAQAVSAFDLFVAPFAEGDGLSKERIKQTLQGMLFELNYPARAGYQSPFTNITLVMDTSKDMLEGEAIVAGKKAGSLGDYIEKALAVDEALFELYAEGDAAGQPFTFPIPTIMLTKNFDWNGRRWGELTDKIFTALSRKGSAYLLNGYASNVEALYAMCCRLTIDVNHVMGKSGNGSPSFSLKLSRADEEDAFEKFMKSRENSRTYGIWALPDATGSIGVVTLNLPRLAALSKGEWPLFEELLDSLLKNARDVLLTWRKRYEKTLAAGLMPLTKTYLGHFNHHFNTIGVIGLPEAAANFMRNPKVWFEGGVGELQEAVEIEKKMVSLIRERASELEERDGYLYNVEEIPGESTGYKLALADLQLFKEEHARGEVLIPSDGKAPFYSNSVVPYYADVPMYQRAIWEGYVQQEFTGGVMMHLFLHEQPDPKALRNLVYRIATNTKVVYFSITPTITVCRKCGRSTTGYLDGCPHCGSSEVEHWSRIVGYYRPVSNWNPGKKAEFKLRVTY
ncbi:anaerobic ribonucleoside triphosphate reductase [Thermofilum pendens]|uniref:Anaerobic ribonucleoside-triphosphate reductase n=1 Tax=Thermofilum pendens (strain DSM 2475 / Hrk 5) TaxID=368408 RepID=A1RX14_THEPD|nr:anaerobic ribonucleoside triphosphate reductase [Thermofilum pendens]ABL77744.1 anaerobic ribonucleoside-triphosphate reductase [Thermofilum pendens Hrk 5]